MLRGGIKKEIFMREIKFRAWDKKFKNMYLGDIKMALAYPNEDIEIM